MKRKNYQYPQSLQKVNKNTIFAALSYWRTNYIPLIHPTSSLIFKTVPMTVTRLTAIYFDEENLIKFELKTASALIQTAAQITESSTEKYSAFSVSSIPYLPRSFLSLPANKCCIRIKPDIPTGLNEYTINLNNYSMYKKVLVEFAEDNESNENNNNNNQLSLNDEDFDQKNNMKITFNYITKQMEISKKGQIIFKISLKSSEQIECRIYGNCSIEFKPILV